MPDCGFNPAEWFKKELGLAIGGATLFIIVSKVSLLLNLLHKKSWYTDLMTFLVALSMGTMYCVTLAQFIPEAFGESVLPSSPILTVVRISLARTIFLPGFKERHLHRFLRSAY